MGQFRKMDPPQFKGDEGPEYAEDFMNDIEKIYDSLVCTPEEKVYEYEAKFAVLSCYGPALDEESRARKFEVFLDPHIKIHVSTHLLTTYEEVY
ncbi:hypothetical protein MLD38_006034 [Melastoma candidum]|uniref:Uncharacterized protein n=1 Tax=Melastoma candidum TaxID=119954 RepID=A0ACB9RNJ0_9MYRT|nr:hypothetical protein MLD38_006034 [Melastoma candidum]